MKDEPRTLRKLRLPYVRESNKHHVMNKLCRGYEPLVMSILVVMNLRSLRYPWIWTADRWNINGCELRRYSCQTQPYMTLDRRMSLSNGRCFGETADILVWVLTRLHVHRLQSRLWLAHGLRFTHQSVSVSDVYMYIYKLALQHIEQIHSAILDANSEFRGTACWKRYRSPHWSRWMKLFIS